jgi:hypothetical protein
MAPVQSLIAGLLALSSMMVVSAQRRIPDCATANVIWQKMGKNTTIPDACCNTNGIKCDYHLWVGEEFISQMQVDSLTSV